MIKIIFILITIAILSITITMAESKTYGDITEFTVVSVYDGDTFKIDINGYPPIIGDGISIRIYGINAPEIRGTTGKVKQKAIKAKEFTELKLRSANSITLKSIRRGKYFRIVSDVYVDGNSLADLLVDNGLAVRREY